jgi:hypothetical protein
LLVVEQVEQILLRLLAVEVEQVDTEKLNLL